jgi:hypothetical protein
MSMAKKKMVKKPDGQWKSQAAREFVQQNLAKAKMGNLTASEFIQHVKKTRTVSASEEKTLGTTFYRERQSVVSLATRGHEVGGHPAKRGDGAGNRGDVGGNPGIRGGGGGVVPLIVIQHIKHAGSIRAAIEELEALEKILGDGTLPF